MHIKNAAQAHASAQTGRLHVLGAHLMWPSKRARAAARAIARLDAVHVSQLVRNASKLEVRPSRDRVDAPHGQCGDTHPILRTATIGGRRPLIRAPREGKGPAKTGHAHGTGAGSNMPPRPATCPPAGQQRIPSACAVVGKYANASRSSRSLLYLGGQLLARDGGAPPASPSVRYRACPRRSSKQRPIENSLRPHHHGCAPGQVRSSPPAAPQ